MAANPEVPRDKHIALDSEGARRLLLLPRLRLGCCGRAEADLRHSHHLSALPTHRSRAGVAGTCHRYRPRPLRSGRVAGAGDGGGCRPPRDGIARAIARAAAGCRRRRCQVSFGCDEGRITGHAVTVSQEGVTHGRSFRALSIAGIAAIFTAACQSAQEPAPEWAAELLGARIPAVVAPGTSFRLVAYFGHSTCTSTRRTRASRLPNSRWSRHPAPAFNCLGAYLPPSSRLGPFSLVDYQSGHVLKDGDL